MPIMPVFAANRRTIERKKSRLFRGIWFFFFFWSVNKFKNVFLSHYCGVGKKTQMNGVYPHTYLGRASLFTILFEEVL